MDLRQLEYFIEICQTGNFTRAAENLFVAQPSVTAAIRKLEAELGVQLFERTNKKVVLTREGQALLRHAEKIRQQTEELFREMNDLRSLDSGEISCGVPPMIGAYLFPFLYTAFKAIYPNITLQVSEQGSLSTIRDIENGILEMGIVILPPDRRENLHIIPITQEEILLCLSPDHHLSKLGKESRIPFAALKDEAFILRKEGSYHREIVLKECARWGFEPRVVFASNQIDTIKSLIKTNVGIAFFMDMVVHWDTSIYSLPLADPLLVDIALAWKKGRYVSRAAQAFIKFIADYVKTGNIAKGRP